MGLLDIFRRSRPLESDDLRRMGRLEAKVESIELQWVDYRDQLKRLVQRLEKRDQRAEQRELAQTEPDEISQPVDEVTARVWARRKSNRGQHGLPGESAG